MVSCSDSTTGGGSGAVTLLDAVSPPLLWENAQRRDDGGGSPRFLRLATFRFHKTICTFFQQLLLLLLLMDADLRVRNGAAAVAPMRTASVVIVPSCIVVGLRHVFPRLAEILDHIIVAGSYTYVR